MFLIFLWGFETGLELHVSFPDKLDSRDVGSEAEKGEQTGVSGKVVSGPDRITDEKVERLGFADETPPKECLLAVGGGGIETKSGGTVLGP